MSGTGREAERGAAAVEFALVLGPLLLIVLGTIDWGYYFYVREVVTNAAREGARAGSIALPPANPQTAARSAADAYLVNANLNGNITQNCGAIPAGSCCVRIDYPVGSITGFLSAVMPANASAQAAMRLE